MALIYSFFLFCCSIKFWACSFTEGGGHQADHRRCSDALGAATGLCAWDERPDPGATSTFAFESFESFDKFQSYSDVCDFGGLMYTCLKREYIAVVYHVLPFALKVHQSAPVLSKIDSRFHFSNFWTKVRHENLAAWHFFRPRNSVPLCVVSYGKSLRVGF